MFLFKLLRDKPVKITAPNGDEIIFKVFCNKGRNKYQVGIEAPDTYNIVRPPNDKTNKDPKKEKPSYNHATSTN